METIADSKGSFIDFSKLNDHDLKLLKEYYNFLLFRKGKFNDQQNTEESAQKDKLPNAFYHPVEVNQYQAFERKEIYGK